MRQIAFIPLAVLAAGLTWVGLNPPGESTTLLVAGKKLDIQRLKKEGTVIERHAGFHRVTLNGSRASVEAHLKNVGAEFVLDGTADTLDRSSKDSKAKHEQYLLAVAKFNGNNEEYATATFKESIDMEIDKRADSNGYIDFDAIRRAQEHRDQMPVVHIGYQQPGSNAPQAPWKQVGPFAAKAPFQYCYGASTLSGRKEGIAVAKTDTNTIWTVGRGGAYKSTDGGSTWKNMSAGWKYTNANCVAIDPVDKNIVYVGTGDYADGGGYGSLPFGIMKTTDGGNSWTNHGDLTTFDVDEVITDIIITPWDRTELICTTRHGNRLNPSAGNVFHSVNSGQTWTDSGLTSRSYTDLTSSIGFTFLGFTTYYVYAADANGTILRTSNGDDWVVTAGNAGSGYTHIAAGKLSNNTIYAVSSAGVKRSTDRGDSWTDFNTAGFPTKQDGGTNWAQMTYNSFVGVTKLDASTERIWVGNLSCATRTSADTTWTDVSKSYTDTARGHADHHSFANDPSNDNRVYIGTDGGLYRGLANSPTSLTGLNSTMPDFQCYSIDVHPTLPDFIMAGMQDNAVMATRGNTNAWQGLDAWDGGFVAFDKVNPKIHYTSSQNGGVYRYTNDFQANDLNTNITPTDPQRAGVAFIPPIVTVGSGSEILLGTRYVLRYPGSGTTWTTGFDSGSTVDEIATSGNTVFFGCRNGNVYRSTDKGSTATRIDGTIPATPIGAIYVRTTADVLVGVMGTSGGLYRSTNAGDATPTWTNVSGSGGTALPTSPINSIAIDPHNSSRWYVGTDAGLFMTANAGSTWANCNTQGFPNVCVSALKTAHGYLYAATAGRGVLRIKIGPEVGHQISGTVFQNGVPQKEIPVRLTADMDVEDRLANSIAEQIPDNDPDGIDSDIINITKNHMMVSCKVFVHINHTWRGDLQVDLLGPNGTNVRLKNATGESDDDLVATYDVTAQFGDISALGAWELRVRDLDAGVTGTLNTWSIIYTYASTPILAETMTNTSGQYAFSALLPGDYVVTPIKSGKVYSPQFRNVDMSTTDIANQNFSTVIPLSLTCSTDKVIGGTPLTAAVRLAATPPYTVSVAISDNSTATIVPSIHQMDTIGPTSFNVSTINVAAPAVSTITATYSGVSETDTVTVYPVPVLDSITAGPTPIYGGTQVAGTVTLAAPAPANTVVQLSGYSPDIVPTTPTVTIPQGQTSANFTANSVAVATPRTRYLKATLGSVVKSKAIFLEPAPYIVGWTFTPNPVIGGETTIGKVQLQRPVVNAPVRVYLTDNSARVSTPAFVDIPVGQTTVTFDAPTTVGSSTTYAGMYAAFANGVGKKYVKLTIAPTLKITSFTFAPNPVVGGNATTGTVVLANPVINAPVRIYLTDNSAKFSMPAFIDIPVGQTTGSFQATTLATTTTTFAGCYAAFSGNVGAKYVKVTITP